MPGIDPALFKILDGVGETVEGLLKFEKRMADVMCTCGHPFKNHKMSRLGVYCYTPEDYCLCPNFKRVDGL